MLDMDYKQGNLSKINPIEFLTLCDFEKSKSCQI